jgi:hypothetical protein
MVRGERMARYRKRPVIVEAVQWFPGTAIDGIVEWPGQRPYIATLEGMMYVSPGDWIITGVVGEKYPCRDDIFRATYEAVEGLSAGGKNETVAPPTRTV